MTYGRSHGTPRRGQSQGQRPPPSSSTQSLGSQLTSSHQKVGMSLSSTAWHWGTGKVVPRLLGKGYKGGRDWLVLGQGSGRKGEDEFTVYLAPQRYLLCATEKTQEFDKLSLFIHHCGNTHPIVLRDPVDTGYEPKTSHMQSMCSTSCDLFLFRLTFTLSPNLSFLIESYKSHLLPNSSPED